MCYPTVAQETACLADTIAWDRLQPLPDLVLLDPCSGTHGLTRSLYTCLPSLQLQIITNDIHPYHDATYHMDATDPTIWQHLPTVDIIACSPPFEILDITLPEFIQRARIVTILHVPGDYLSNGPSYRRKLWRHRTAIIEGLPRVAQRPMRRCIWLLVFSSARCKHFLWRPSTSRVLLTTE